MSDGPIRTAIKARNVRQFAEYKETQPHPYACAVGALTCQIEWLAYLIDSYGNDELKEIVKHYVK